MRNRYWEDRRRFESGRGQSPSYPGYGGEMDRSDESQRWGHEGYQGDWSRETRGGQDYDRGEWSGGSSDWQRAPDDWGGGAYGSPYSRQSAFGQHTGRAGGGNGGSYDSGRSFGSERQGYGSSRGQSSGYSPDDLRGPSGMYQGSGTFGSQERYGSGQYGNRGWMGRQREIGPHSGKGPKGYTRSDDRIREDISDRLMADGDVDASEIEVDVRGGEVVLRGVVDSRETKRCVEDVVDSVQGVQNVQNQLRLRRENGHAQSESSSTTSGGAFSDASSRNRTTEASSKHR